jgi:hypothetical protein
LLPTRRAGGARREVTERVHLFRGEQELDGWALNVSRGGLRLIVEDKVSLGEELGVVMGDGARREGRIVWIQEEPDGSILGMAFLDAPEGAPPPRQGSIPDAAEVSDAAAADAVSGGEEDGRA